MIKRYGDRNYNCKLMVIRREPVGKDSYWEGQFIIEYFVKDEYGRILELWEGINTPYPEIQFIRYADEFPKKDDYTKDELVLFEEYLNKGEKL